MIFLVGAHATGKTYLADIIGRFNFVKIDLGPILRTIHDGELKFGSNFTDDLLVNEIKNIIKNSNNKKPIDFIITGSRSVTGLKYILEHIGHYDNKDNKVIFLEAPFAVKFKQSLSKV